MGATVRGRDRTCLSRPRGRNRRDSFLFLQVLGWFDEAALAARVHHFDRHLNPQRGKPYPYYGLYAARRLEVGVFRDQAYKRGDSVTSV